MSAIKQKKSKNSLPPPNFKSTRFIEDSELPGYVWEKLCDKALKKPLKRYLMGGRKYYKKNDIDCNLQQGLLTLESP